MNSRSQSRKYASKERDLDRHRYSKRASSTNQS
jgi:hypothetical protein